MAKCQQNLICESLAKYCEAGTGNLTSRMLTASPVAQEMIDGNPEL